MFDKLAKRRAARRPAQDTQALAQVLGLLGQSNAVHSLRGLAQAAEHGVLEIDAETQSQIAEAQAELGEIRRLILRALGKSAP